MINTDSSFYGQQADERILYVVKPHSLSTVIKLLKVYTISFFVFIAFYSVGSLLPNYKGLISLLALALGALMVGLGSKLVTDNQKKNLAYLTDRRIVRFEPTTFFATNIRTLSWDEVVKVKTFSPNMLWKQLAIGSVVVHARTPTRPDNVEGSLGSVDDIHLTDVYLYRDVGNYIDKILFTYKRKPKEVAEIHPFIPKPMGQRY
ncbi:hypothetical protein HY502_02015 [Candidatus Woesebacteria bacterium]|nr:hypothetical protein [Candidatus Woesebacteria bacterium]